MDFTAPLSGRSQGRTLNEIAPHPDEFPRWRRKFLETLARGYGRAPGARHVLDDMAMLLDRSAPSIAALAEASVRWAAGRLGLAPRWLRASDIDPDPADGGQARILRLCRLFAASAYVNAPGGRALYAPDAFAAEDVALRFIAPGDTRADLRPLSILHALLDDPDGARAVVGDFGLDERETT